MIEFKGIKSNPTEFYFDIIVGDKVYPWNAKDSTFENIISREDEFVADINLQIIEGLQEPKARLTKEELIKLADEMYRNKRNQLYIDGMSYNQVLFSITSKIKQDYTALAIMKDSLVYPYTLWGENGKIVFADSLSLMTFLLAVFSWIQEKEIICQKDIENLVNKTRFELLQILNMLPSEIVEE